MGKAAKNVFSLIPSPLSSPTNMNSQSFSSSLLPHSFRHNQQHHSQDNSEAVHPSFPVLSINVDTTCDTSSCELSPVANRNSTTVKPKSFLRRSSATESITNKSSSSTPTNAINFLRKAFESSLPPSTGTATATSSGGISRTPTNSLTSKGKTHQRVMSGGDVPPVKQLGKKKFSG